MARHVQDYLDTIASRPHATMGAKVRECIYMMLASGLCSAAHVAKRLGTDRRTMHRHLAKEGETFSSLLDSVRGELRKNQVAFKEINIQGGTSVVVPITIRVPKNANPGDIVGGVVVSDVPQRLSITSVQQSLAVATRIGIRTIVRVDGTYRASVKVSGLTTSFTPSLTHPGYGSYTMSWDVENDGNVRVAADRSVDVRRHRHRGLATYACQLE